MADRPQDLINQSQAGLEASGVPLTPELNPTPIYADPAAGPVDPTAVTPEQAARPPVPPGPRSGRTMVEHVGRPEQSAGLQPPAPPGPSGGGMAYETTTTRTLWRAATR